MRDERRRCVKGSRSLDRDQAWIVLGHVMAGPVSYSSVTVVSDRKSRRTIQGAAGIARRLKTSALLKQGARFLKGPGTMCTAI